MAGKRPKWQPESVILDRYNDNAQLLITQLDEMRDHQRKCTRCRNIPGVRQEARPCAIMTGLAIMAAGFWAEIERNPQFEQMPLFEQTADPWRVN